MTQSGSQRSRKVGFIPFGIIFAVIGVALFVYFVKRAGVGQIAAGISRLGAGFFIIIAISALRQIARSIAWMMCFEAPYSLRFWDAFRACVVGDVIGNFLSFACLFVFASGMP